MYPLRHPCPRNPRHLLVEVSQNDCSPFGEPAAKLLESCQPRFVILPFFAVLPTPFHVGTAPSDADANDSQGCPRGGLSSARYEPALSKLFRTQGMGMRCPRLLAPQQHLPAPGLDRTAPILACVNDMAAAREKSRIPFGHAEDVAVGRGEFLGDDGALLAIWSPPLRVPSADSEVRMFAVFLHSIAAEPASEAL